ncbi:MAG TPA: hypothetical protein PK587_04180 [Syntrophales bacterium]|nr:hypothetical protein [Syntrophales bacterium]
MKIYIASSWRNQHAVELMTDELRRLGFEVKSFVEKAVSDEGRHGLAFDVAAWIESEDGREKFDYDTNGAMSSDLVIYIGPSGCDAWAEIGAAYASGRHVFGLRAKGEQIGLMRRMVTWYNDYRDMMDAIWELKEIVEYNHAMHDKKRRKAVSA